MNVRLVFLITVALIFNFTTIKAQTGQDESTSNVYQNVGIPISQNSFNLLVENEIVVMHKGKQTTIKNLICMARIYNTIVWNHLNEKEKIFKDFQNLFIGTYSKLFVTELNAKVAVGMSYYSKKYNIYWGGLPHANSLFRIVKANR